MITVLGCCVCDIQFFFLLKGNECTTFAVTENIIKLAKGLVDVENLWMTRVQLFPVLCMYVCVCLLGFLLWPPSDCFVTHPRFPTGRLYWSLSHWTACCDWQSIFNGDKCDCWALPLPNLLQQTPEKERYKMCVAVWVFLVYLKRHLSCDLCQAIRMHEMILVCLFFSSLFRFL